MPAIFKDRDDIIEQESSLSPFALKSKNEDITDRKHRLGEASRPSGSTNRPPFEHDKDRILASRHFRRLGGKTQMFIAPEDLNCRTRLVHTMEVYQIATSMARRFNLNVPAVEAITLAHDIGHPPFGHAGERVLDDLMKDFGGFHHATNSVRVVDRLAYVPYLISNERTSGLNLTYGVREGIFKHGWYKNDKFERNFTLYHYEGEDQKDYLDDSKFGSLEAQVVELADSIAYLNHDIADLMEYGFDKFLSPKLVDGFLNSLELQREEEIKTLFVDILTQPAEVRVKNLVLKIYRTSKNKLEEKYEEYEQGANIRTRELDQKLIKLPDKTRQTRELIYEFFNEYIYNDVRISSKAELAQQHIKKLFDFFYSFFEDNPDRLPRHLEEFENDSRIERYLRELNQDSEYEKYREVKDDEYFPPMFSERIGDMPLLLLTSFHISQMMKPLKQYKNLNIQHHIKA